MFSRFIHIVVYISTFFVANNIPCMIYHILSFHSSFRILRRRENCLVLGYMSIPLICSCTSTTEGVNPERKLRHSWVGKMMPQVGSGQVSCLSRCTTLLRLGPKQIMSETSSWRKINNYVLAYFIMEKIQ